MLLWGLSSAVSVTSPPTDSAMWPVGSEMQFLEGLGMPLADSETGLAESPEDSEAQLPTVSATLCPVASALWLADSAAQSPVQWAAASSPQVGSCSETQSGQS